MTPPPVTQAELAVRIIRLQRAHDALAAELSATAAAIRAQIAAAYTTFTDQQTTDEAELASILTTVILHTAQANQTIRVSNPGSTEIRVAILCITTNLGTVLPVAPGDSADFTDAQAGDIVRCVSVDPFTAALIP